MNLIKEINKKLKEKRIKLTAITTAVSLLATGVAPSFTLNKEQQVDAKKQIEFVIDEVTEETSEIENQIYETKNKEVSTKKTVNKNAINIGNYNGTSIVNALEEAGYDSSYAQIVDKVVYSK